MRKCLISLRMSLTVAAMLIAGLLLIRPHANGGAAAVMPQGKGGAVKPVPTPTPGPKRVTTKKSTTPSGRGNTNQTAKSKEDEAAASERTYWETIRSSTDPEDFRAYLKRYPNGVYADLANNRIRALEAAAKPQPLATSTPTPTPEPVYEWSKPERELPARIQLEFHNHQLSFSVPSGWTRSQEKEGSHYLHVNFRAPDSPPTNISIQLFAEGIPRTLRNGAAELWRNEKQLIDDRRRPICIAKRVSRIDGN